MNLSNLPIFKRDINEDVVIPRSYYENSDIKDILPFKLTGKIFLDDNQDYVLELKADLILKLEDCYTLDLVSYPISIDISEKIVSDNEILGEFIKNEQNTLDIIGILWENIVLEVPISFSVSEFKEEFHDGWEVVREKKEKIDPRWAILLDEKEKE